MIRAALIGALCLTAGPGLALSCMAPDVAKTYARAAEADESYVVVRGRLTFDATQLPKTDWQNQQATPPHTPIAARITGQALSLTGFDLPFERDITLDVQCFGPWCAGAAPETDYLGFLEQRETGYVLVLDPCGGMGFANPTPEMLDRVKTCFQGGPCVLGDTHYYSDTGRPKMKPNIGGWAL